MDSNIKNLLIKTYKDISFYMEKMEFKEVSNIIISLLDKVNKYYDEETPWISYKEDINRFNDTIYTCSTAILNIANYIEPIMPNASKKIREYLNINECCWEYKEVEANYELPIIEALFTRI